MFFCKLYSDAFFAQEPKNYHEAYREIKEKNLFFTLSTPKGWQGAVLQWDLMLVETESAHS